MNNTNQQDAAAPQTMTQAFDAITGWKTAPPGTPPPMTSRADEIRTLAAKAAEKPPAGPVPTGDAIFANTPEAAAARASTAIGPKIQPFFEQVGAKATDETAKGFMDAFTKAKADLSSGTVAGGMHSVADVANGVFTPFASALNAVTGGVVPKVIEGAGRDLANLPGMSDFLNKFNDYFDAHPDVKRTVLEDLPTFANIAAGMAGATAPGEITGPLDNAAAKAAPIVKGAAAAASDAVKAAGDAVANTADAVGGAMSGLGEGANYGKAFGAVTPGTAPGAPDPAVITDSFNKAIKPSVSGKGTSAKVADYNGRVVKAVTAINENKPNLELTDADGNVVKGETPKTVGQFSDAIGQTKASIFKKYDAMATAAGDQGAKIDLAKTPSPSPEGKPTTISDELDSVINDKTLGIAKPEAVAYAKSLKERISTEPGPDGEPVARKPLSTSEVQGLVQHMNDSLKAFYRNPSYDTASRAAIDALVANKARSVLDSTIENSQGPGYQALRDQYGALKTIEADVAKRSQVIARQNAPGLVGNLSNIASGAELARGLLSLNPADLAASATIKGIQLYAKWLNNPDRLVSKMFDAAAPKK